MSKLVRFASLLAVVAGSTGAVAVIGCSALVDLSGLSTGITADGAPSAPQEGGGSNEASTTDSGDEGKDSSTSTDAQTDAGDDAVAPDPHVGPNLLPSSDFEGGCTWGGFQGTPTTDSTARTGSKSCRICTDPSTTDYFTIGQFAPSPPPVVGDTYHATVWLRTAPGTSTPPGGAVLFLRSSTAQPFTQVEQASTNAAGLPFTSTWQRMEVTLKPTKAAAQLDVYVGASTAPGACFLVDDVWLEKLPAP